MTNEEQKENTPTVETLNPEVNNEQLADAPATTSHNQQQEPIKIQVEDIGKIENTLTSSIGQLHATSQDGVVKSLDWQSPTLKSSISGDLNLNANVQNNENSLEYNLQADYSKDSFNINTNYSSEGYQVDSNYTIETENDLSVKINVHKDNNDEYISLSGNKTLNPNNINNTNDTYKERREDLLSSNKQFSFESKVGYNESFYTNNSLMMKFNDKNIVNASCYTSEKTKSLDLGVDLNKLKLDYSHNKTNDEESKKIIDRFDANLKTKKHLYNLEISNTNTNPNSEENSSNTLSIGSTTSLNRNEYGEFSSGLSGAITNSVSIANGKINGFSVHTDGAYNHYGQEHNSTTDYLIGISGAYTKENTESTVDVSTFNALRINNCRTIFEQNLNFTSTKTEETKESLLLGKLGVYQQVGKEFGQASIFTAFSGGKAFKTNADNIKTSNWIGTVAFGGDCKVSKNISISGKTTYDTRDKFSGEISGRISF